MGKYEWEVSTEYRIPLQGFRHGFGTPSLSMMLFQPSKSALQFSTNKLIEHSLTDHVHHVPEAEEAGPVALAGGDLEVAGDAAAVGLCALE